MVLQPTALYHQSKLRAPNSNSLGAEMGFRAQKYFCDLSIRWYESFSQGDLSVGFQRGKDLPVDVETNAY